MKNGLSFLALTLALGSIAFGAYTFTRGPADTTELELRLTAVEDELSRVEAELGALREATKPPPSLMGLTPEGAVDLKQRAAAGTSADPMAVGDGGGAGSKPAGDGDPETMTAAMREMVDAAVEKKAEQLRVMRNKKPSLEAFADVLALDDEQREAVAQGVVQAQSEIRAVLLQPAEDGTVFLDEFVETFAHGIANPGKDPQRGARLFQRLIAEKVPGSDATYAQQAEAAKAKLRETFKRTMSPKQYATFEAWQMDPSEVQGVPGSPWKELEGRIRERARALGANLPDEGGPK